MINTNQGLETLNQIRADRIIGGVDLPPVALITAQRKKLICSVLANC